jgi:hypothetical protein
MQYKYIKIMQIWSKLWILSFGICLQNVGEKYKLERFVATVLNYHPIYFSKFQQPG